MHFLVVLPLLVTASLAAPAIPDKPRLTDPVKAQPKFHNGFPAPVSATVSDPVANAARTPVKIEYDFPAPISAPAAAAVKAKHNFSAPISTPVADPVTFVAPTPIAYVLPSLVQVAAPTSVQIAALPVTVAPPAIKTRVHHVETPVVIGHTSHIIEPNLGAVDARVTNFDFLALTQTKTAAQEHYVQKSKVLAPVHSVSETTSKLTVKHPTKINVEKVAAPYA